VVPQGRSLAVVERDEPTQVLSGAASVHVPDGRRIGSVVGESYRIVREIAAGGMGTVYEAQHVRLHQRFAVKFLDRSVRDPEAYARFRQEAEIAASLDHDAIVGVFDFNVDADGSPYMVMELVDGVTLDGWMQGRRATPREVIRLFDPLCSALAAAHAAGIVHRDLKPSNVMVRGLAGETGARLCVKLLDFGISKIASSAEAMTRTNVVMGTPNYMSPEQASGNAGSVDATTDIFALGAMLYELLSGRRAFEAASTPALLHAIVYEHPTSLSTLCPDLPPAVVAVVEKCLAKAPADRFADAPTFMVALRAALRVVPPRRTVEVAPVDVLTPSRPRGRGFVGLAIGWAATVVVASTAAAWWVGRTLPVAPATEETSVPPIEVTARETSRAPDTTPFRHELATPGALVLESGTQLYRADARGVSYWSDPEAETVIRPLPSAAAVVSIARAREGDVLVGQSDGTVTRWDRELREVPWQKRFGSAPVHAIAAAGGYVAFAVGNGVTLVHGESGRALKELDEGRAVALLFSRHPTETLIVVRPGSVELVDADKRKSLGQAPLSGVALRAELVAEPIDAPTEVEIDFLQGDWVVRRRFRVHHGRRGQVPRLEPVGQRRL
jgi:serine/threonine-protein kinase